MRRKPVAPVATSQPSVAENQEQWLKVLSALLTKYETDFQEINKAFEALPPEDSQKQLALVGRLAELNNVLENTGEKRKIMTQPMRNALGSLERNLSGLLTRLSETIIDKIETDLQSVRNQFCDLMNAYAYDYTDDAVVVKFRALAPGMQAPLNRITGMNKALPLIPSKLGSRLLRVQIKVGALFVRFELMASASMKAQLLDPTYQMLILGLLRQFENVSDAFSFRDDEETLSSLYFLYELQMSLLTPKDSPSVTGFIPRRFINTLAEGSAPGFTQLMAFQSYMLEVVYYINDPRNKKTKDDFSAIIKYRKAFVDAYRHFVRTPDYLGNISLAKAHFVAYRYHLVFHHYHICGTHNQALEYDVTRQRTGEWEIVRLLPEFTGPVKSTALMEFIEKERELRNQYFLPCVELIEALDFDCLPLDVPMQNLLQSIVMEGLDHFEGMSEKFNRLLASQADGQLGLTPRCAETLKLYCQELSQLYQRWKVISDDNQEKNLDKIVAAMPNDIKKLILMGDAAASQEKIEEKARALVSSVEKTVQKQTEQEKELEKKVDQAFKEMKVEAESEHKKNKRLEKKRLADAAAQHEAWAQVQRQQQEKERQAREVKSPEVEKPEDKVEAVPEVESESVRALHAFNTQVRELGRSLFDKAKNIHQVLDTKHTTGHLIKRAALQAFRNRLDASLVDFQALRKVHDDYLALAESLSPEESQRWKDGIAVSVHHIESLEDDIEESLFSSAERLKEITEKSKKERDEFIMELGAEVAAEKGETGLSLNRIKTYGLERFREIGPADGLHVSPISFERLYLFDCLNDFYPRLQALRRPSVTVAPGINHDPKMFGETKAVKGTAVASQPPRISL